MIKTFPLIWHLRSKIKIKWEILSTFVAFSEYMNFIKNKVKKYIVHSLATMCFIWFFRSLAILPWCTQQWRIGLCSLNGWSNWVVTSMPRTKNITPHYIWLRCIPGKVFRYLLRFDLSWPQFFHYGLFLDLVGIWWGF